MRAQAIAAMLPVVGALPVESRLAFARYIDNPDGTDPNPFGGGFSLEILSISGTITKNGVVIPRERYTKTRRQRKL